MSRVGGRDDFSKKTVELLARRSGGKCAICCCTTWGPNDKPYTATNIGQAAHIMAAAEGGPRYDPSMSHEMRSSIKNGLWLCSNCHHNVDRNPQSFSIKYLRTLKEQAEERARKELGVAIPSTRCGAEDQLSVSVSGVAIIEVRKLKAQLAIYHTKDADLYELNSLLVKLDFLNFNEPHYLTPVATEVIHFLQQLIGYHDDPSLKLEVVRYLSDITHHFILKLDLQEVCETLKSIATGHSPRQPVYQSVLALLKNLSQKTPKTNPAHKIITDAMATVAKQRGRRATGRAYDESVDFDECISPKIRRLEGEEEEDIYLEKMLTLAELSSQEGKEIEREVAEIGFESDIL